MKLIEVLGILICSIMTIDAITASKIEDSDVRTNISYGKNNPRTWKNNESNFRGRRGLQKKKSTKKSKKEGSSDTIKDGIFNRKVDYENTDGVSLAVTAYWIIFNKPESCISNPAGPQRCGSADWHSEDTALIHAVGGVSDNNGFLQMATTIVRSQPVGDLGLSKQMDPFQLNNTFTTAHPEVGLLLVDHGAIKSIEQLFSFRDWEGCQRNNCGEIAFVVYWTDMQEGPQPLMGYIDRYYTEGGGYAVLRRKNDGLQLYIEAEFPIFDLNDRQQDSEENFSSF